MVGILFGYVYRLDGCWGSLRVRSVLLRQLDFEYVLRDREIDRK